MALVGLFVTGLMEFSWFFSRSSSTVMDRWLSVSMIVFALIAFCGLVIAILRMRVRLTQHK
jgi:multidrug transporter EmrE-like cation transporter